jgi:hypothetical protein
LLDTKIYGVEKIDIADWVNAVQVFSQEECNQIVKNQIQYLIGRGNFLKDKEIVLSEEDKRAVDLALAKQYEAGYTTNYYSKLDDYKTERRKEWEAKFK